MATLSPARPTSAAAPVRSRPGLPVFLRCGIALLLAATAVGKLLDVAGFAGVIASYRVLPEPFHAPVAWGVPLAELALAGWLAAGRGLAQAALASAAMHAGYAALAAVTLLRGVAVPNCGCFGVFLARPLTWATPVEDGVLIAASFALWRLAR